MISIDHDSHVFYVTAQGYAADHWYSWLVKSFNAHPEMFAYLANEGSRPKYFPEERSRSERPDIIKFTKFISDVGRTYEAVGDCYSYRAYQMKPIEEHFQGKIRWVNITRHPYVWLHFYVRWRSGRNMRMDSNQLLPIEHEWKLVDHRLYKNLRPYSKEDSHIWAFYRGLTFLENHMMNDLQVDTWHIKLEDIIASKDLFCQLVSYLTHSRINYTQELLNMVYSWRYTPFRGEERFYITPESQKNSWEKWQIEAFDVIVSEKTRKKFKEYGYEL